jgi:hypothetical protein
MCTDINPYNLVDIQSKCKYACPFCGPRMKSRHSISLGKDVFDEYRSFHPKNHRYRSTEKHICNSKEETGIIKP